MESTAENSKTVENIRTPEVPTVQSNPMSGSEAPTDSLPTNDALAPKVPKPRSDAWLHFIKLESGDKAKCKHCSALISCRTKMGSTTSAMLNHVKRCRSLIPEEKDDERKGKRLKQSTLHNQTKRGSEGSIPSFLTYDADASRKALIKMIIKYELAFRCIEREGFREFMSVVQPRFTFPSRRTIVRDCFGLFVEERKKLQKFFKSYSYSVCLTTDIWTSRQNLSYLSLTAHFINDDWKLHKKIINFCQISNHSGEMIGKMVEKCLFSWGIGKVFTITVDNASANDVGIRYLKDRLKAWGGCVLDGAYLHMRCGAHILNLIVKDGLSELNDSIERIRTAIRYVRSSGIRLQRFKACMEQQKLPTNSVPSLDVDTRWNSTYLMLESALKVKKAFDLLELQDGKYRDELMTKGLGLISEDDWSYARGFVPFLKFFYDTTVKISGSQYVTGNFYMKEIFGVAFRINLMSLSGDEATRSMSGKMMNKFYKYWGDFRSMNLLVYLATVLDPRHKMQWVSWSIEKVYNEKDASELVGMIKSALDKMFKYYESFAVPKNSEACTQTSENDELNVNNIEDFDALMASMYKKHKVSQGLDVVKSELERYLADDCEVEHDPNFDILYWWKTTGSKYKTLSLMARDLLAMPVSTVASESAFSTGGRVLDPYRSSLTPKTVEALVCTQDWIRKENRTSEIEEALDEFEKLESEVSILTTEPTLVNIDD